MQRLWCWRCKAEMPMLDEAEFAEITELYRQGMEATKAFRQRWNIPMEKAEAEERMRPMLHRYTEMTGYVETNPNAVMHHRLSLYGPPCGLCGRPLRTPKAKLCGSCMASVRA